jgi:endoglucanase
VKNLKTICDINGGSGDEKLVRDYILSRIKDCGADIKIDNLGNIIVLKKGKQPGKKIVLGAHMDEVSFIITHIADDGTLIFAPVGGIDAAASGGRRITVNGHLGVIGTKAVHNLKDDEKKAAITFENLKIDIGAADKSDAEKYVNLGDRAYFEADFAEFGQNKIASKAIDDRFGCEILIDLICSDLDFDCTFAFFAQEEVGCRGSKAADITADYAIIVETTTAADIDGAENEKRCCKVSGGSVISYMDRSTVYDREMYEIAKKTADENDIMWQTKTLIAGGNDASSVNTKTGGIKTAAISLPCRYLHTASVVADKGDIDCVRRLTRAMITAINKSEI